MPWYWQMFSRRKGTGPPNVGIKDSDSNGATNSDPVFTGTGTEGTVAIVVGSMADTDGFFLQYDAGADKWSLANANLPVSTVTSNAGSPWAMSIPGIVNVTITENAGGAYNNNDSYTFSIFKYGDKRNAVVSEAQAPMGVTALPRCLW